MKIRSKISAAALILALPILISASLTSCSSTTTPSATDTTTVVFNSADIDAGVFRYNSSPGGKTYAQWSASWWIWAMSMPATSNGQVYHPMLDTTGAQANLGNQGSSVFFIGGKFTNAALSGVTRTVTIPHRDAIFFPIAAMLKDPVGIPSSAPSDTLSRFDGSISGTAVTLDGKTMINSNSHIPSGQFSYVLPDKNVYQYLGKNAPAGSVSPAVADGIYIMLAPLSIGKHVLKFSYNTQVRSQGVTYNITSN